MAVVIGRDQWAPEKINGLKWNESTPLYPDVRFYPSGSAAIQTGLLQERKIATLFFLHTLYCVSDSKVDNLSGYNSVQ